MKKVIVVVAIFLLVFGGVNVHASYDGASVVEIVTGNFNPFISDKANIYTAGCAHGINRWAHSGIDSDVKAEGYVFYYDPAKKKYVKKTFSKSANIKKTGKKEFCYSVNGKQLTSKYDDAYTMSAYCHFELECNKCGETASRTRSKTED